MIAPLPSAPSVEESVFFENFLFFLQKTRVYKTLNFSELKVSSSSPLLPFLEMEGNKQGKLALVASEDKINKLFEITNNNKLFKSNQGNDKQLKLSLLATMW